MRIIFYEDEQHYIDKLHAIFTRLSFQNDIHFEQITANTFDELIQSNQTLDICINIIDIEHLNQNKDGVSAAKLIRDENPASYIIFYTSHIEKTLDIINEFIEPLAFIYKADPLMEHLFEKALLKVITKAPRQNKEQLSYFTTEDNEIIYINLDDIHFIRTSNEKQRYIEIYTYDRCYIVKGMIKEYVNKYDFLVQTSKSCIVHKAKVKTIKKGTNPKNKIIDTAVSNPEFNHYCILSNKYKSNLL